MNKKYQQNIHHMKVNVNLMVQNVIQFNRGIIVNVNVSAKIQESACTKKIIFGILVHVFQKMVNVYEVILVIQ